MVSLQPELEQVFVGKTYADIIESMGPPERTTPDGKDGNILIYEQTILVTESNVNFWGTHVDSVTQSEKGGYIHLYINPSNRCYMVKTNREREESEYSKGKTITLLAGIGTGFLLSLPSFIMSLQQKPER